METFDLLVHENALETLRRIRGVQRRKIREFFELLLVNPYLVPDAKSEDAKGRIVRRIRVGNCNVDYVLDDPVPCER